MTVIHSQETNFSFVLFRKRDVLLYDDQDLKKKTHPNMIILRII